MRNQRAPLEPIKRSQLTKALTTFLGVELASKSILFGRGTAPPDGGWPDATPNKGLFKPYTVIKAGVAVTPASGERDTLAANRGSWLLNYQLTTHHSGESKVDDAADLVRETVILFNRGQDLVLDGVAWTIQQVLVSRLGATTPTRASNPPHWQVTDDVSLHLSRAQRL